MPMDVVTCTSAIVVAVVPDTESVGAVTVREVSLMTLMLAPGAGVDPKVTAVAPVKPVPVNATVVPPVVGPDRGLTPVTVGVVAASATLPGLLPITGRTMRMIVAATESPTPPVTRVLDRGDAPWRIR